MFPVHEFWVNNSVWQTCSFSNVIFDMLKYVIPLGINYIAWTWRIFSLLQIQTNMEETGESVGGLTIIVKG